MILVSLVEGAGILLLIPMINISGIVNFSNGTSFYSSLGNLLNTIPDYLELPIILSFFIMLVLFQSLIQQNLKLRNTKILIGFTNHIRLETYKALLQANWSFFVKKRKSDLINIMTGELGRVVNGTNLFLQFCASLIFSLVQLGIAFWLSPLITIFVFLSGVTVLYFSKKLRNRSKYMGEQTSEIAKGYLGGITDHFNGVKDIKSNMLEHKQYTWLKKWCETVEKEQLEYQKIQNLSQLIYKVISAVLIAVVIYFSVQIFKSRPEQLIIIVLIFSRLWPRFTNIQSQLEQLAASISALKNLQELQHECLQAKEIKKELESTEEIEPLFLKKQIECKQVYFRYTKNQQNTLSDINFIIPANQTTAVVGRSGAGKSTLIDIIMGMINPEKGNVFIDDIQIDEENLLSYRKSISYVPQDPFLFNGSIRENLSMVSSLANEEEIWEALEFASAKFVKNLPNGLNTIVGDRGIKLSGGERQRIVLARAILRRPSILVLDEATSALDSENEAEIQEALEKLKGKMTIVVIAHRLSTIKNADQIIVLEDGKIVQNGNFKNLLKEKQKTFNFLLKKQIAFKLKEIKQ
jgi:ABC-type multidrug transport system fused ATPase/permease subunit